MHVLIFVFILSWTFSIVKCDVVNQTNTHSDLFKRFGELKQDDDFGWLLSDLAMKLSLRVKCVTIISDPTYHMTFGHEVFNNFRGVPYLQSLVEEYEDLLNPNFKTLAVIQQARLKGCNAYIILLANAEQTSRFLRFGDRYRVLDTRATYVINYDQRLFTTQLHYLWKKMVNVLFIRKFLEVPRYEFTTVPFPASIGSKFIPRRLDTWRAGKFQAEKELFSDKTTNLKSQTLRIAVFEHMPSVVKILLPPVPIDETTPEKTFTPVIYKGLEVEILKSLSDVMNFETRFYEPTNAEIEAWGRKQLNGSFSGLLGEVTTDKCDMALGNFLHTPYNLQLIDLSIPYITQCFTFLTPESMTDDSWKTLILPFNLYMWIAIICTLLICSIIFYGLAKYQLLLNQNRQSKSEINNAFWKDILRLWQDKSTSNGILIINPNGALNIDDDDDDFGTGLYLFQNLAESLLNAYSMLLLVSLPKMPTGWSLRMFTGWWWIYCLLVTVAYRASMTAILAKPAQKVTIDTLEELAASPIGCGGWGEENKKFFTTSLDLAGQRVGKKFDVVYNTDKAINRVARGKYAYYENIFFLLHAKVKEKLKLIALAQSNDTQENKPTSDENLQLDMHIMEDCIINMPVSLALQKNSPLKPKVDVFLQRFIEAGLVKKWLGDVMTSTSAAEAPLKKEVNALMNFKKFYGAIVVLLGGSMIGIILLFFENVYWYFFVVKDPHFDKYNKSTYYSKPT